MKRNLAADWLVAAATMLACACASGESAKPAFEVVDSTGVELVHNDVVDADLPVISLGEPIAVIGSEEPGPELFGRIGSVSFAPDSTVWITDASVQELRVFRLPSGEHLFTAGGKGEGPGEFKQIVPLGFDEKGQAWIWDEGLGRVTVLDAKGKLVDVRLLAVKVSQTPRMRTRTPRGTYVTQLLGYMPTPIPAGSSFRNRVRLWEIDDSANPPRLLVERSGVTFWHLNEQDLFDVPFSPTSTFAARGDRIVVTDSEGDPAFDVIEDGRLVRRVTIDRERALVTTAEIDTYLSRRGERGTFMKLHLSEMPIPKVHPTWDPFALLLSARGDVFLLRESVDEQIWDVFAPSGRQLGVLTDWPTEVGDHYLAVVESGVTGVRVRIHALPSVLSGGRVP
jgi:hypothetical protein